MRHLIVEGPDAGGKDGFIAKFLGTDLGKSYTQHQRASTSLGGPVPSLADWVTLDLITLKKGSIPYVYNRHPLISERIYAPHRLVNPGLAELFEDDVWVKMTQMVMAKSSVLLIVQPSFAEVDRVMNEQGPDAHMPGVFENRLAIYDSYAQVVWPGTMLRYNRDRQSFPSIIRNLTITLES